MGKTGRKNKSYSAEFKISVIMDMREHHLGYRETARKYDLGKSGSVVGTIQRWERIPKDARPILHSDQGWQYQHAEYQRLLAEHNITQSMSRKGNCMDNGAMENFFGRLKVEMFYGEQFQTVDEFIGCLEEYIDYYNNERIVSKLKMSPVQYRTHLLVS